MVFGFFAKSTELNSKTSQTKSELPLVWDVFCHVVDNFGDIGVCLRLARQLAARGQQVRLWVDDASALVWMQPLPMPHGLQILHWSLDDTASSSAAQSQTTPKQSQNEPWPQPVADVVLETFACPLPKAYLLALAKATTSRACPPVWINLEYLSAEDYVQRSHGLPSPQMHGPAQGLIKWFFYPGFVAGTGGLLREDGLPALPNWTNQTESRQQQWQQSKRDWLAQWGLDWCGERLISLFCYEPQALPTMLIHLGREAGQPSHFLLTHGRAAHAFTKALQSIPSHIANAIAYTALPPLSQADFDRMLDVCDINFVRGEDSLVRGLWAGKPMVWQLYPQHDCAHHAKLEAFLTRMDADPASRVWHRWWNAVDTEHGDTEANPALKKAPPAFPAQALARLWGQPSLCTQLQAFVHERRKLNTG